MGSKPDDKREELAREVAELRRAIREKHQAMKRDVFEADRRFEKQLKPLTDPLKQLLETRSTAIKQETKDEWTTPKAHRLESSPFDFPLRDRDPNQSWIDLMTAPARYANAKRNRDDVDDEAYVSTPPAKKGEPPVAMDEADPEGPEKMDTVRNLPIEFSDIDGTAGSSQDMTGRRTVTAKRFIDGVEETYETKDTIEDHLKTPVGKMKASVWVKANFKGPLSQRYLTDAVVDTDNNTDNVYGVHFEGDELRMGGFAVLIDDKDDITVDGVMYPGTKGLFELLFKRRPDPYEYSQADLVDYKNMLEATSAHRVGNMPHGRVKSNTGEKYTEVIRLLFPPAPKQRRGKGMSTAAVAATAPMMELREAVRPDYVYFDDPNELCDRLRLLISSRDAGHTGHTNEINSIVEELRELGLIKGAMRL